MAAELEDKVVSVDFVWSPAGDSVLFGTSYMYLIQKLTAANEKTSLMSFQETENGLKGMMKNAEYYLSQFANNELAWEYSANTYKTTVEKSVAVQEIVQKFDQMMYADTNIYGFAILSGDGRSVFPLRKKRAVPASWKSMKRQELYWKSVRKAILL